MQSFMRFASRRTGRPRGAGTLVTAVLSAVIGIAACEDSTPTGTARAGLASARESTALEAEPLPPVALEVLSRGAFPDKITATFRIKTDEATEVVKEDNPSDVVATRIVQQPGASTGWHTHPGPVIVLVASGEVTITEGASCTSRVYTTGQAFVDPGQGHVHLGVNSAPGETILYATFLGVPPGQSPTLPAVDPGC